MMSAVSGMVARASAGPIGRSCAKAADFLDCAIPLALVAVIVISAGLIAGGIVH